MVQGAQCEGMKGVLDIEGSHSREVTQAMHATRAYISTAAMVEEKGLN